MRVLVTGATRRHRFGRLRRAPCARRRGRRPQPQSREGAADEPDGDLARVGPGERTPARRRVRRRGRRDQPRRRGDQPALERGGEEADPREPDPRDQEPRRRHARRGPAARRRSSPARPSVTTASRTATASSTRTPRAAAISSPRWSSTGRQRDRSREGRRSRRDDPHRPHPRARVGPSEAAPARSSSSAAAVRSPAAISTCRGSTSTTRSALILWALDTEGISGPVNSAAPNPVTNQEFSKMLGKVLKRPAFFPGAEVRRHGAARRRGR